MARFFVLTSEGQRKMSRKHRGIGSGDFGLLADIRGETPRTEIPDDIKRAYYRNRYVGQMATLTEAASYRGMTAEQLRTLDELAQSGVVVMASNRWRQNDSWYFRDRNVGQQIVREQEAQSHRLNHRIGYSESCRHCIAEGKVPEYARRPLLARTRPIERQRKARLD